MRGQRQLFGADRTHDVAIMTPCRLDSSRCCLARACFIAWSFAFFTPNLFPKPSTARTPSSWARSVCRSLHPRSIQGIFPSQESSFRGDLLPAEMSMPFWKGDSSESYANANYAEEFLREQNPPSDPGYGDWGQSNGYQSYGGGSFALSYLL